MYLHDIKGILPFVNTLKKNVVTSVQRVQLFHPCNWQVRLTSLNASSFLAGKATSMQRFVRWLDQCNTTRKLCSSKTNKSHTPARFLNVKYSSYDHLDSVRLVDTNPEKAYSYIALSHRWDEQTEKVCTTTSTIEQYKTGIRLYILSDQFQEAIRITRTIGIEYI